MKPSKIRSKGDIGNKRKAASKSAFPIMQPTPSLTEMLTAVSKGAYATAAWLLGMLAFMLLWSYGKARLCINLNFPGLPAFGTKLSGEQRSSCSGSDLNGPSTLPSWTSFYTSSHAASILCSTGGWFLGGSLGSGRHTHPIRKPKVKPFTRYLTVYGL